MTTTLTTTLTTNIYDTPEHALLREQVARFIAKEVEPHAQAWEEQGMVPREVLQRMGRAGLLGLMYEGQYGGGEGDALSNLVFAEALSQSTFAGFIITVLVHTDMASPHLHHAGTPEQKAKYMPRITAGECISAVGISEPGAGSDVAGIRTSARREGNEWVINGMQDVHHQRRACRCVLCGGQNRAGQARHVHLHCGQGHARLHSRPRAQENRLVVLRHRRVDF
jgi:alkylation response protein AidB-like acyl-CoA dehydrogenase